MLLSSTNLLKKNSVDNLKSALFCLPTYKQKGMYLSYQRMIFSLVGDSAWLLHCYSNYLLINKGAAQHKMFFLGRIQVILDA